MDPQEIAWIAGRTALIYVCLLAVVRVNARRPLTAFSALDLVTLLVIGEIAGRPVYGEYPLAAALGLIAVLSTVHFLTSYLFCLNRGLDSLLAGSPRVLIRNGEVSQRALAAERISERDLRALLRERDVERLDDVKLATLEPNGQFTVVKTERARRLNRKDLQQLLVQVQREAAR